MPCRRRTAPISPVVRRFLYLSNKTIFPLRLLSYPPFDHGSIIRNGFRWRAVGFSRGCSISRQDMFSWWMFTGGCGRVGIKNRAGLETVSWRQDYCLDYVYRNIDVGEEYVPLPWERGVLGNVFADRAFYGRRDTAPLENSLRSRQRSVCSQTNVDTLCLPERARSEGFQADTRDVHVSWLRKLALPLEAYSKLPSLALSSADWETFLLQQQGRVYFGEIDFFLKDSEPCSSPPIPVKLTLSRVTIIRRFFPPFLRNRLPILLVVY